MEATERSKEIVARYKVEMIDLEPGAIVPERYDFVQPKMDGWWTFIEIRNHAAQVITSGGEIRDTFKTNFPDCDLVAEWIYGTNWSQTSNLKYKFIVFDIARYGKEPMDKRSYSVRLQVLDMMIREHFSQNCPFSLIYTEPACNWETLWKEYVIHQGYEGLVFKSDTPEFKCARMKMIASCNYVIMEVYEGNGRLTRSLGGFVGGLYINGVLVPVCKCGGGFTDAMRSQFWNQRDELIGKVFEVHGKILFSSGALRHPNFYRWRPDYPATDCVKPFVS